MAKCVNCVEEAVFIVKGQGTLDQSYCDLHLPKFFNRLALPDNVKKLNAPTPYDYLRAEEEAAIEAVREKAKAKKKAAPAPEPEVVEEPAAE